MTAEGEPTFPPLMWGEAAPGSALDHAVMRATVGCDAGLVTYNMTGMRITAALVFAPEVPLRNAMAMLPLCGVGLQNALGALAPPEVAVHLDWSGGIRVNGAGCGRFAVYASDADPGSVPDWLVVGFTMPFLPDNEDTGLTPDQTALYAEGCADVSAVGLIESWSRHTLAWISRWEGEGSAPLHAEWRGLLHNMGEVVAQSGKTGTFLGVDEDFGMLLREDETTHLIPLTDILEPDP